MFKDIFILSILTTFVASLWSEILWNIICGVVVVVYDDVAVAIAVVAKYVYWIFLINLSMLFLYTYEGRQYHRPPTHSFQQTPSSHWLHFGHHTTIISLFELCSILIRTIQWYKNSAYIKNSKHNRSEPIRFNPSPSPGKQTQYEHPQQTVWQASPRNPTIK